MAVQVDLSDTVSAGGVTITQGESIEAGAANVIDESIPNGSTDLQVNLQCDISKAYVIAFICDQAVTLKTNSSSTPDDTIALAAGVMWKWVSTQGAANPLSADITALFVTNASGSPGQLKAIVGLDPTPAS